MLTCVEQKGPFFGEDEVQQLLLPLPIRDVQAHSLRKSANQSMRHFGGGAMIYLSALSGTDHRDSHDFVSTVCMSIGTRHSIVSWSVAVCGSVGKVQSRTDTMFSGGGECGWFVYVRDR